MIGLGEEAHTTVLLTVAWNFANLSPSSPSVRRYSSFFDVRMRSAIRKKTALPTLENSRYKIIPIYSDAHKCTLKHMMCGDCTETSKNLISEQFRSRNVNKRECDSRIILKLGYLKFRTI